MSRSMSRRQSIGYPGTPYPQSIYPEGLAGSDVSSMDPFQHDPPDVSVVPPTTVSGIWTC